MAFFGRHRRDYERGRERDDRNERGRGGSFTRDWGDRRYQSSDPSRGHQDYARRSGSSYGANPFERPEEFGQNREPHADPWRSEEHEEWRDREPPRRGSSWNDRWQNSYGSHSGDHTDESDYARYGGNQDPHRGSDRYREDSGRYRDQGTHGAYWSPERTSYGDFGRGGYDRGEMPTYGAAQYRGRGPKGYRRSDERIHEEVCEYLTEDHYIDATNIEVHVKDCEVTLTGHVGTRAEKRRADDLIDQLAGVRDVHNQLRVVNDSGLSEPRKARPPEQTPPSGDQSAKH